MLKSLSRSIMKIHCNKATSQNHTEQKVILSFLKKHANWTGNINESFLCYFQYYIESNYFKGTAMQII